MGTFAAARAEKIVSGTVYTGIYRNREEMSRPVMFEAEMLLAAHESVGCRPQPVS